MHIPKLLVINRQRKVRLSLLWLRGAWLRALPECLSQPGQASPAPWPLTTLTEVEITLISQRAMVQLHTQFFQDPTPTDVITFPDGQILICPQVAEEAGKRYQQPVEIEVLLYGIHGLLHLYGFNDLTPQDQQAMTQRQEYVLNQLRVLQTERCTE